MTGGLTDTDIGQRAATGGPFGKKALAWSAFEFARNPYYNLIVAFIFVPYFADVIAGGGAGGQAIAATTVTISGVICALCVPLLGAAADRNCRMKPMLAVLLCVLGLSAAATWLVAPDLPGALVLAVVLLVLGYCSYTFSEVLHNAMLTEAGRREALPVISGLSLAAGNFAAVLTFLIMLCVFILPAVAPGTLGLPTAPPFGLSAETFGHVRIVGPLVAVWLAVFILPFFLFMPERQGPHGRWPAALGGLVFGPADLAPRRMRFARQLRGLGGYIRALFRDCPEAAKFLLARVIYADGLAAVMTIGPTYAALMLGWGEIELAVFGLLSLIAGVAGAFAGGYIDRALGAHRALVLELVGLVVILVLVLSITRDSIIFGLIGSGDPLHGGPVFTHLPDLAYLGLSFPAVFLIGAIITASRVLMVDLAPPARLGEFFGLYMTAGTVTVWMGPGLIALVTALTGDQRLGMASILVIILAGLWLLARVRAPR